MFNSYHAGNRTQNLNINAVSGSILKNHPKSWFITFHLDSNYAKQILVGGGHRARRNEYPYDDPEHDIIILQMMLCGDMQVIAECVYRKDYESKEDTDG